MGKQTKLFPHVEEPEIVKVADVLIESMNARDELSEKIEGAQSEMIRQMKRAAKFRIAHGGRTFEYTETPSKEKLKVKGESKKNILKAPAPVEPVKPKAKGRRAKR
jgi:hypothetical protein